MAKVEKVEQENRLMRGEPASDATTREDAA